MAEDISEIKVDVGILKTQVLTLSALCNKMDQVIEKLVDQHDRHINKVYDTMDNQRKETNTEVSDVHERIDMVLDKVQQSELRIMAEIKDLKETMSSHVDASKAQYEKLNQWKWTLAGGIIVITWLISHSNFDTILKALH
jgi:predicted  nucleic acid-binding Zn-ribbon protein|tara:strand:+ start:212 stop:631 length:420 start_codon:yes stop_codon:yes gene_type:complete